MTVLCLICLFILSGCDETTDEEAAEYSDSSFKQVGETVNFTTQDGGRCGVTLKAWGSEVRGVLERVLYIDYDIENTGDQTITIGNSMFSIYADDYVVEEDSLGYLDKGVLIENVAPGKKVSSRLYGEVNPEEVDKIEVVVGDTTFAIKGEGVSSEAAWDRLLKEDQVAFATAGDEPITDLDGTYTTIADRVGGEREESVIVSMYSSPEDYRVGEVEITKCATGAYSGEIAEIKTNVYQLVDEVNPVIVSFSKNSRQETCVYVYLNGMNVGEMKKENEPMVNIGFREGVPTKEEEAEAKLDEMLEEEKKKVNELLERMGNSEERSEEEEKEESDGESTEYIIDDSSTRLLKKSEVKKLDPDVCRLAKNEIYARHGRRFQDQELQKYFDSMSWYKGSIEPDDFDESVLSKIEKKNIKLLAKYEKK